MAKILYINPGEQGVRKFAAKDLAVVEQANSIIEEYEAEGYQLTLRQLYYQFVARGLIANKLTEYKRLGAIINDGRLAGLVDWDAIEDRTRNLRGFNHYEDPGEFLTSQAEYYRANLQEGQDNYIEVWVEKDALVGVIEQPCANWDVDYFACRGYVSQSEQHGAAMRILSKLRRGHHKKAVILHLGDHDPSGIDMTRDIEDRTNLFLGHYGYEGSFRIKRLALNMNQVEQYNPPPNPAKLTDSRCAGYMEKFGDSSWELDALEPRVITALIDKEIKKLVDPDKFAERRAYQEEGRDRLRQIANSEF